MSAAALRSNLGAAGDPDAEPARVTRVDPHDGDTGVFRDSPVVVGFSHPVDPASLSAASFHVEDPEGRVPGRMAPSPDGQCLIWTGDRLFAPDTLHFVVVRGIADRRGREVAPHISRFVPCDLAWSTILT